VVLHVDGDGCAHRGRRLAHLPRRLERDLLAVARQPLPERGQLHRHLDPAGEALIAEPPQQGAVGGDPGFGLRAVGDVLAEVVDGDEPVHGDPARRGDRGVHRRAGDETVDERVERPGLDGRANGARSGRRQQGAAEHAEDRRSCTPERARPNGQRFRSTLGACDSYRPGQPQLLS
jgi:hypothetical protein